MIGSKNTQREKLYALLGDLPPRDRPLSCQVLAERECEHYILEILLLDLNGIEGVPAYYAKPKVGADVRPTILYNHAHGGDYIQGKNELIENQRGLQKPTYAQALTGMGYNVLCIDHWNFGERCGKLESVLFKEMLWKGQVLWGMMVYDSIRTLDYLCARDDVDGSKIGTVGISMGSTMGWWLSALDERIACCVDLCCLTDFHALIEANGLEGHGIYYYVPRLLKEWTTAKINALIAPRPHLSLAGNHDLLTPPKGLDQIDAELQQVYADEGVPEAWKLIRYGTGHQETFDMRQQTLGWLRRWLG